MTTPDNRAHRRPQEKTIINAERNSFEASREKALEFAKKRFERNRKILQFNTLIEGFIIGKKSEDVNLALCNKIIRNHRDLVLSALDSLDPGILAAYIDIIIQNEDNN